MLPQVASAYPRSICGRIAGYESCAADYGPGGYDLLLVKGPEGTDLIRVVCSIDSKEYRWDSNTANGTPFLMKVSDSWCNGGDQQ